MDDLKGQEIFFTAAAIALPIAKSNSAHARHEWFVNADHSVTTDRPFGILCIYQPPNAHMRKSHILLGNAMAAAAVKKISRFKLLTSMKIDNDKKEALGICS
jgi:hypothetical protein